MHEQYKQAMSGVRPSAQCTERIINMTNQKRYRVRKGWLAAAIVAAVLLCAAFTANAATNGALFDGTLFQNLHIFLNGKEYTYTLSAPERSTDKDGNPVDHYSIDLPDGKTIDAYAAEEYTAFSVDADDVQSIQIVGTDDETE